MKDRVPLLLAWLALASVTAGSVFFSDFGIYFWTAEDEEDPEYLVGHLTWRQGTGGVSWTNESSPEDPGGSGDLAGGAKALVGWNLRTNAGTDAGLIPATTFVSDPLPALHWLNASRTIQLDLFLKSADCPSFQPQVDAELSVDGNFLGGEIHGVFHETGPDAVDGWCVSSYRMHPELDRLAAGSRLTLRFVHHSHAGDLQFGLAGNHQSVIRIPFYTHFEAQARVPELEAPSEPDAAPGDGAAGEAAGGALGAAGGGVALGLAWPAARRRTIAVLGVLLLATAALSGCIDGGEPRGPGSGSVKASLAPARGLVLEAGFGAVAGVVQEPGPWPLGDAVVRVLGTRGVATSDGAGKFLLVNVPAGTWVLRADREDFVSVEAEIGIRAGNVTDVTVTMVPLRDLGLDGHPHAHDQWGDETRFELSESDVTIRMDSVQDLSGSPVASPGCINEFPLLLANACSQFFPLENPELEDWQRIVRPGTDEVEVVVTWDESANRVDGVGVAFSSSARPAFMPLYPRASGVPTHVRTSWEMADAGHQHYTNWQFLLYVPTNSGAGVNAVASVGQVYLKPFHVEIILHKGIVPLEPAHRDFWGDEEALPVLVADTITEVCFVDTCVKTYPAEYTGWRPENLTAPGTRWLDVALRWTYAGLEPLPEEWGLVYKPANVPYSSDFVGYRTLEGGDRAGQLVTWRLAVEPGEADGFYQKASQWLWLLDDGVDGSESVVMGKPSFYLSLTAHRGPMP